jgi:sulfonate transport system substrate-binding protein
MLYRTNRADLSRQLAGAQQVQLKRRGEVSEWFFRCQPLRIDQNEGMNTMVFRIHDMTRRSLLAAAAALGLAFVSPDAQAQGVKEIRLDWATYNPVSIVLKERGILEKALEADGVKVRWVQSLGSNKALEFLNAGSIDFGSTAGSAALVARINGNPIKSVYVYSRPEWTALVTTDKAGVKSVADLKGKRVAVTRGTDPHIFLVRALAEAKLTDKDVKFVLLQHGDGRLALERGDVDAWAGLDPIMAAAELESGAKLFYRKPEANTWGILNVREAFAAANPELVRKVLGAYEEARKWSLANPNELKTLLAAAAKLPENVVERQLTRTELTHSSIGLAQYESIRAAGQALVEAGVLPPNTDVKAALDALLDRRFTAASR